MSFSTKSIRAVLFDWDGTLVDSAGQGREAFRRTFSDLNVPFDDDRYDKLYSPNWYTMYEALGLPRQRWPEADDLWIRHYGEEPARLVEGGRRTVEELHRRGMRLGVVTSGSNVRVMREIGETGLETHFDVIVCHEDTVHKKPHPEGLEKAMERLNAPRSACSYVGDSPEDIEMGRQAGVMTIGVRSGYPGSRRLSDVRPDIYLESLAEILRHF